MSLRALGNAGRAVHTTTSITKCLTAETNPLEVRVAAAEAFRRVSCEVQVKCK